MQAIATDDRLRKYLDVVYASAIRQVGNGAAAEDVTQAVFLVMARKAKDRKLPEEKYMLGWLLKVTGYAVKEWKRAAVRRGHHERVAGGQLPVASEDSHSDERQQARLREELDAALLELGPVDREVV